MLKQIEISGYRGFKQYTMSDLARVNLLVGENNCGKTSILECVEFLASGGEPWVLERVARRRSMVSNDRIDRNTTRRTDVSVIFTGFDIEPGISFSIKSENGFSQVRVEIDELDDERYQNVLFEGDDESQFPILGLTSIGPWYRGEEKPVLPIAETGILVMERRWMRRFYKSERLTESLPIISISQESLDYRAMAEMWDSVLHSKSENGVYDALRLLEPDFEDIAFESSVHAGPYSIRPRGVLVSLKGFDRRVPLGSLGDGVRRLLALAISLVGARKGLLLIDEIDTGLHYSIMADMWKLVIQTAIKEDIQVFATTHSYDCIQGLAEVCRQQPELQSEIAVHKIHGSLEKSVPFHGRELPIVSRQDIEVR